ncbi:MAG: nuclear transport factor 2 family protein [Chloroflexota bacterium]|nr:nuclear transport factor 2 family protein [Chloroflexota bacterium]
MNEEEIRTLVRDHVDGFNTGVRTGDWAPMLERFVDDAELVFEGVPVAPFVGRDAIADAYRAQPPDDEIDVLGYRAAGDEIVAPYVWVRRRDVLAGELRLTVAEGRIRRIVVTFREDAPP